MKVKATKLGYYGHKRRKEGDVFDLVSYKKFDEKSGKDVLVTPEQQFSEAWMVKVKKGSKVPEPEPEVEDEQTEGSQGSEDDDVI